MKQIQHTFYNVWISIIAKKLIYHIVCFFSWSFASFLTKIFLFDRLHDRFTYSKQCIHLFFLNYVKSLHFYMSEVKKDMNNALNISFKHYTCQSKESHNYRKATCFREWIISSSEYTLITLFTCLFDKVSIVWTKINAKLLKRWLGETAFT